MSDTHLTKSLDDFMQEVSNKRAQSIAEELQFFIDCNPQIDIKDTSIRYNNTDTSVQILLNDEVIVYYEPVKVDGTLLTFNFERVWLRKQKYKRSPMSREKTKTAPSILDPTVLTKHIRDKKGRLTATLVAVKLPEEDKVYFGWSKYHRSMERKPFVKSFGRNLAIKRALKKRDDYTVPYIVWDNLRPFVERAKKYFKDCEIQKIIY